MSGHGLVKAGWAAVVALGLACGVAPACTMDQAPQGLERTPPGPGVVIRYDMFHKPLPEIPLPNNIATWPDPTSRTGLRVNASLVASTDIERAAREKFSEMEGWGTFPWITVGFGPGMADGHTVPKQAAIDLQNIIRRHQHDDYDLRDDAIYLVNLETGVPIPLDLGEGTFNYTIRDKNKYWENDPRRSEENLLFETYDEAPGSPDATYSAALDNDFDGVLDRPDLDDMSACPPSDPSNPDDVARDRCIADHYMGWYERETDTLIARPIIPMEEMTEYAVVITDRLVDKDGYPVKSPFEFVYHPLQERGVRKLHEHLSNPALASYYGDIGGTGLEHVAFAWTFTTEPTYDDMRLLRNGLYGTGPFAELAGAFPAELQLDKLVGLYTAEEVADGADPDSYKTASVCSKLKGNVSIVHYDDIKELLGSVAQQALGMSGKELEAAMESYSYVDYMVVGSFQSPFFLQGGPQSTDPNATFHLNYQTGKGDIYSDRVTFWMTVPKKFGPYKQPFPLSFYGHGYMSSPAEILTYAGNEARQGIATIGVTAAGHGLVLGDSDKMLLNTLFKGACLAPFADAIQQGRARDLNNDGVPDPGGDFWTSYIFHTRDLLRQTVLEQVQATRIFRSFDGKRMGADYDGDGQPNLAGDFDGDGTVDVGGPDVPYTTWGESLGGIVSAIHGAVDPYTVAAVPTSGGGGLIDIGVRSFQGGVVEAVVLRLLSPMIVGVPVGDAPDPGSTSCAPGQVSVRWVVVDVNDTREVEIACASGSDLPAIGGTVLLRNLATDTTRCVRSDGQGRFRIAIPASMGDPVHLVFYGEPDNVDAYDTCNVRDPSAKTRVISKWSSPRVAFGAEDDKGNVLCANPDGCVRFQGRQFAVGDQLVAPADGYGYLRQSPSIRRFIALAQSAIDPADPINYAPYFALKRIADPWGNPVPPHAVLNLNTIGDMNVPVSAGINYGRASGALPFLRPEAAGLYPALRDYVTPDKLYADLGNKTPNRVLIDHHVIEGVSRLGRAPAGAPCAPNESPASECHPACPPADPAGQCLPGQTCSVDGVCAEQFADPATCQNALFDPEDLGEGAMLYAAQTLPAPLRLARRSAAVEGSSLDGVWAPRLMGVPHATSDQGAWDDAGPVTGMLDAYIVPQGKHCFETPNPCRNWDYAQYLVNIVGRFFSTQGKDLYYLSHPASHECMQDNSCPLFPPLQ